MTFFTSGDWIIDKDYDTSLSIFDFMCDKFPVLKDSEVELNQVDLYSENAYGFCQVDEDGEFLIHIHNDLDRDDYIVTLIHELVHVKQTLTGLMDYVRREEEALIWEKILFHEFKIKMGEDVPAKFLSPTR